MDSAKRAMKLIETSARCADEAGLRSLSSLFGFSALSMTMRASSSSFNFAIGRIRPFVKCLELSNDECYVRF
jgi:hypothetical protein